MEFSGTLVSLHVESLQDGLGQTYFRKQLTPVMNEIIQIMLIVPRAMNGFVLTASCSRFYRYKMKENGLYIKTAVDDLFKYRIKLKFNLALSNSCMVSSTFEVA